jgi:SAM-dependent methyltransferase
MSNPAKTHYDNHLGSIYEWMTGDFEVNAAANLAFYKSIDVKPFDSSLAIDLGAGHGLHAIPLAQLGFDVIAIDGCRELLERLSDRAKALRIKTILGDLSTFESHMDSNADAIVCMGDTLTHLSSVGEVNLLIGSVFQALNPGGTFCVSFRDYCSSQLEGVSRFIPIRSDGERIHTCFLEYDGDFVVVTDLVHSLVENKWVQSASAYCKIRLDPDRVIEFSQELGLQLVHDSLNSGMRFLAFRKINV